MSTSNTSGQHDAPEKYQQEPFLLAKTGRRAAAAAPIPLDGERKQRVAQRQPPTFFRQCGQYQQPRARPHGPATASTTTSTTLFGDGERGRGRGRRGAVGGREGGVGIAERVRAKFKLARGKEKKRYSLNRLVCFLFFLASYARARVWWCRCVDRE